MRIEANTQKDLARAAYAQKQALLTGPQTQARYQRSHVTIWRWVHDPDLGFPPPIKINRLNYWRLAYLEQWEAAQAAKVAA